MLTGSWNQERRPGCNKAFMYLIVCNMNNIPSISLRRIHLEVEKIWLSVWLGRSLSSCGELRRDRLKYSQYLGIFAQFYARHDYSRGYTVVAAAGLFIDGCFLLGCSRREVDHVCSDLCGSFVIAIYHHHCPIPSPTSATYSSIHQSCSVCKV